MMISKSDLKDILRENDIKVYSWMGKQHLLNLAKDYEVLPEEPPKPPKPEKPRDPRFDRNKPRKVTVQDVKTGEIHTFPSIFRASKFIYCNPQTVCNWSGRVWEDKYRIKVAT